MLEHPPAARRETARPAFLRAIPRIFAGIALCAALPCAAATAAAPARVAVYVSAHQDDWQLFAGDLAVNDVLSARRVAFIYVTSGIGGETDEYWRARERAALASQYLAANTEPKSVALDKAFNCDSHDIGTHRVRRCRFQNVASYHLRLPNSKPDGAGYETTGMKTLNGLRTRQDTSLQPVDGTRPYTDWQDLRATLRAIFDEEAQAAGTTSMSVFTHDPDPARSPHDHPDHTATGRLVTEAIGADPFELVYFVGYNITRRPANLSLSASAVKGALFRIYDLEMAATNVKWYSGTAYVPFFDKTYVRKAVLRDGKYR